MEAMIAQIKGTTISDATARLIACHRFTDDVYENIMHALSDMYGEYVGEEIMEKKCLRLFNEVEGVIRELIAESIAHNIGKNKLSEL